MALSPSRLTRLGLGPKLSIGNLALVTIAFAIFITIIGWSIAKTIESRASAELSQQTRLITDMIEASNRDMKTRVGELIHVMQGQFKGHFELKDERQGPGTSAPPRLLLNDRELNHDDAAMDDFTRGTGAVATIFVKSGNDFVRITTSLRDLEGKRVKDTALDHNHPAYTAITRGGNYIGPATLYGKPYMTQYEPINNPQGQIIGLLFVGLNISEYMKQIQTTIGSLNIGKIGYFYVLDTHPGKNYGLAVIHPRLGRSKSTRPERCRGSSYLQGDARAEKWVDPLQLVESGSRRKQG